MKVAQEREVELTKIMNSDSEDFSNGSDSFLIIDSPAKSLNTPPAKRQQSRKCKRMRNKPLTFDDITSNIAHEVNANLQNYTEKIELPHETLKNIINNVVSNQRVIEMVKLHEEEQEQAERQRTISSTSEEEVLPLKFTRLKAKELNQKPLSIQPLGVSFPDDDVLKWIHQDLHSDDDDDEYRPGDDGDIHSDDDNSNTISDMDSQPRTPATPCAEDSDLIHLSPGALRKKEELVFLSPNTSEYTNDGLFKVPRPRTDSLSTIETENIALRTRSKLSLSTTPIEIIESTLVPPDITLDMYDFGMEIDDDWLDFITAFRRPMNLNSDDLDDEADPEYVGDDKLPLDKEELRAVKVSRKEVQDLINELLECDNENLTSEDILNFHNDTTSNERIMQQRSEKDARIPRMDENMPVTRILFDHNCTATPKQQVTKPMMANHYQEPSTPASNDGNVMNKMNVESPCLLNNNSIYYEETSSIVPDYSSTILSSHESQISETYETVENVTQISYATKIDYNPRVWHNKNETFAYLFSQDFKKPTFDESIIGFTYTQRALLDQQMRQHIQLASQSFIQTFGHPTFDDKSEQFRIFIDELNVKANEAGTNSAFNAWNLPLAVDFCKEWQLFMAPESQERDEYHASVNANLKRYGSSDSKRWPNFLTFHPWIMTRIVESPLFMYPNLLPPKPFNCLTYLTKVKITWAEEFCIASGLEACMSEHELRKLRLLKERLPFKRRTLHLLNICKRIVNYISFARTPMQLCQYIKREKSSKAAYGPIRYYFTYHKAPAAQHNLIAIAWPNPPAPENFPENTLPAIWNDFVKEKIRQQQHNLSQNEQHCPQTDVVDNTDASESSHQTHPLALSATVLSPDPDTVIISYNSGGNTQQILHTLHVKPCDPLTIDLPSDFVCALDEYRSPEQALNHNQELAKINPEIVESPIETPLVIDSPKVIKKEQVQKKRKAAKYVHCLVLYRIGKQIVLSNRPQKRIQQKKNRLRRVRLRTIRTARQKLSVIIGGLRHRLFNLQQPVAINVRNLFATFDLFVRLWKIVMDNGTQYALLENLDEHRMNTEIVNKMCSPQQNGGGDNCATPKRTKASSFRPTDTYRQMLQPEAPNVENERDKIYAENFFDKVKETYTAEKRLDLFEKFHKTLTTFDPARGNVADLYRNLEKIFMPHHPELAEIFLTFLMPGHAAEIGRFFEHFMLTNMTKFVSKLQKYFLKQPAQIKKILMCLNELAGETDCTIETVRDTVLPLLKGNQMLIAWFLELFPAEKPALSLSSDYETISLSKATAVHETSENGQPFEFIPVTSLAKDALDTTPPCATRYLNGDVYYGHAALLPAQISFLTPIASARLQVKREQMREAIKQKPSQKEESTCSSDDGNIEPKPIESPSSVVAERIDSAVAESDTIDHPTTPFFETCVHEIRDVGEAMVLKVLEKRNRAPPCKNRNTDSTIFKPESIGDTDTTRLCDAQHLKAHAVRLHPTTVFGVSVEQRNDMLRLLDTVDANGSPKKRRNPNSPGTKKAINSISSLSGTPGLTSSPHNSEIDPTSPAIGTAKRLKKLIEARDQRSQKKATSSKKRKISDASFSNGDDSNLKKIKVKLPAQRGRREQSLSNSPPPIVDVVCEHVVIADPAQPSTSRSTDEGSSSLVTTAKEEIDVTWTRAEDKIILEEMQHDFDTEPELYDQLQKRLSNRKKNDIQQRYQFLLEVLQKLQLKRF